MRELIDACSLCGYCDGICPKGVRNIEIVLHLRRELNGQVAPSKPATGAVVPGCTIRERAPHLVPSIVDFLKRIGRPTEIADGCCGALDVEAGRATPARAKAGVVCDPVCFGQHDADYLGALALARPEMFDFGTNFYYFAPHRLINGDHARWYPVFDGLRRRTGCEMNLDMNRLARATSAGSINVRDLRAAVARLLKHSKADRVITCSPADYLAFREFSGRETRYVTECLK